MEIDVIIIPYDVNKIIQSEFFRFVLFMTLSPSPSVFFSGTISDPNQSGPDLSPVHLLVPQKEARIGLRF